MPIDFSRRDFLKKTSLLAGGAGVFSVLPASIQKAMAINPAKGSTFEDAEHIVLLMQENRSFDHCFGALKGVRGFNDPRVLKLADGNPVWLQTDKEKKSYLPFRLDMQQTKITWMGGLPHSWGDQVDARNNGQYDQWLIAKRTGYKGFEGQPMTLGYYTREDIPFNYALADAFTVCDQHFCSSLTGTTPNRLYFWSGTLRKDGQATNPALVRNSESDYSAESDWKTLPELLQEHNIAWKVYQNELSLPTGLEGEAEAWLSNFTDNPLEWFTRYRVRRSRKYEQYLVNRLAALEKELPGLEQKAIEQPDDQKIKRALNSLRERKKRYEAELERCRRELAEPLSSDQQALHDKAFATNDFDPDYHETETIEYDDHGTKRKMQVPKSDVLANFRKDVKEGKLPAVSWLVAPQYFSDHPSAPWFGAWYVSEVLDILTHNEEVWKKTVFILTYDENDGYFDHVPPFTAPDFRNPATGAVSSGITNIDKEFVTLDDEIRQKGVSKTNAREGSIGLGYRVPFVVASPWSRGGYVNSQVFDHTSVVQFIEKFASRKTGKKLALPHLSEWRRAVCGDLSSVFRPYNGETVKQPEFLKRDAFLQRIDEARYRPIPEGVPPLQSAAIRAIRSDFKKTRNYFIQEKGAKPSSALPYELYADAHVDASHQHIELVLKAGTAIFKERSMGSPFSLYAYLPYNDTNGQPIVNRNWSFAVAAGETLTYPIPLSGFAGKDYHLALFGPNGFYRELKGHTTGARITVECRYTVTRGKQYGQVQLLLQNHSEQSQPIIVKDNSYGQRNLLRTLAPGASQRLILLLDKNFGWYDFSVLLRNDEQFERRFAGRVETGKESFSDPLLL
ncbi:phosphocholine-specific phospholipase C [Niabella drilacis]|uniref:phospholipase C n=1 Tax=Niabella drilacis (strain DSM 25811 / CCM 8410 / CCUG 62505 / LMG 26954 / E90) TaxID=1285928 RepID=A0A1G6YLS1_NIADE|nr:phospholipase C, phosphocholine-specific [Niabella drilacis]SDD90496.1 phospholipase C [Niabella drilacis]